MIGKLNLLHSNDRKGQHAPSWYDAITPSREIRPQLTDDITSDVCIIGAGFTGLSSALHLRQLGYSVCVLEAHRAGWGASGRNGGQVGSGQRLDQDYLEKHYGTENALRYWQLAEEAKALVRDFIRKFDIDCHPVDGIIHADHKKNYLDESKKYCEHLNAHYGYENIHFLEGDDLREMLNSPRYFGGILDTDAFHLNPLALANGVANGAEAIGAKIFELSEVTEIQKGKKPLVKTKKGSVSTDHIIIACNGYLGNLEPSIARKVLPINNFVIVSEPLDDTFRQSVMATKAAVADSKFVVNYFRMTHDNRLLFGGGENYGYNFPKDIMRFVQKPMLEIFPQMKDKRIDYGWGGTLAVTPKRLPLFERISDNILNCSGYSGHGIALANLAGKIAAEAINGQASDFDLMANLKTPNFPGGVLLRYPMLVAAMTWFSLRDRI